MSFPKYSAHKLFIRILVILTLACRLLTGCAESSVTEQERSYEQTTELTQVKKEQTTQPEAATEPEPVNLIMRIEPQNISCGAIPESLTVIIENTSKTRWTGGEHCAIDYFTDDEWKQLYSPIVNDIPIVINPHSTHEFSIPTDPEINNYAPGKYRVSFGYSVEGWQGWYGEFTIT